MRFIFAILLYTIPTEILQAQVTLSTIFTMLGAQVDLFVRAGVGIALIVFIWGVVRMMIAMNTGESDKAIAEGKQKMVWGIVGLFMVVSIWGIVAILMILFGADGVPAADPPIITQALRLFG